jgi:hypothetical protein
MDTDAVVASGCCRNPGGRAVARLCAAAAWRGYVDALEAGDARGAAQRARKAGDAEAERLRATSGCGPRRVRGQTGTVDEPAKREEDTDE